MLRVCLDARLIGGTAGGVESVVIGLASGLSHLTDGDEEYLFLVWSDAHDWLRPYLSGPCRTLPGPPAPALPTARWKSRLKGSRLHGRLSQARNAWTWLRHAAGLYPISVPQSDGTIERAGVDLMHFTTQAAFLTSTPSIFHPHDLQHVHLPQFFSMHTRLYREATYRAHCRQAQLVPVVADWGKRDLMQQYNLPADKVAVVPFAPVLTAYRAPHEQDLQLVKHKYQLPDAFIFYPAQTWAHKNHCRLLEALARLRSSGLKVPLVCSGYQNDYFPTIQRRCQSLGLSDQVRFLGFVDTTELQCLYKLCRSVVVPTLFEAASGPLWDAFLSGAAAACSNVTSLPEQAGDAALVFDPRDSCAIASAIEKLWTDADLRDTLVERGYRNVARYSWDQTARIFRAHYRRLAGRPLTAEDRELIGASLSTLTAPAALAV